METSITNNITREVGITGVLKFENCNINVTTRKNINEFLSDFFRDSLEGKIVYIIQNRRSFCARLLLLLQSLPLKHSLLPRSYVKPVRAIYSYIGKLFTLMS
jgi:hypothetical protein